MRIRKPKPTKQGEMIAKIRKPMAPPGRTLKAKTSYSRKRELEKLRRETETQSVKS